MSGNWEKISTSGNKSLAERFVTDPSWLVYDNCWQFWMTKQDSGFSFEDENRERSVMGQLYRDIKENRDD